MDAIEIDRDYFEDVNPDYEESTFDIFDVNIYSDPDSSSSRLYDALYKLFFYDYKRMTNVGIKRVRIVGQKYSRPLFYSFFVEANDSTEFILSVDYIGPSKFQSRDISKLSYDEIKNNIKESRKLGGHILWPRGEKYSINQTRGGDSGRGIYDRIDWTFLLLKKYYEVIELEDEAVRLSKYKISIRNYFKEYKIISDEMQRFEALFMAFDCSINWFKKFESFKGFCDFFRIKGSFVTDSYEVVELTSYFPIKPDEIGYLIYIENNIKAIGRRNYSFK